MTWLKAALLALALLLGMGCSGRKTNVGLDVDMYLHPESSSPDDLLLETAIRKQLKETDQTKESIIHIRVIDSVVFLSGSVKSEAIKEKASTIASGTEVSINTQPIKRASLVKNRIEVIR